MDTKDAYPAWFRPNVYHSGSRTPEPTRAAQLPPDPGPPGPGPPGPWPNPPGPPAPYEEMRYRAFPNRARGRGRGRDSNRGRATWRILGIADRNNGEDLGRSMAPLNTQTDWSEELRNNSRDEGVVTKMGGGESYRPMAHAARSPVRVDNFRNMDRDRSPRRRSPLRDRRRSRSPMFRRDRTPPRDTGGWRPRARSPRGRTPPRRYSPRRDDDRRDRPRSPRRDDRRRSRSPFDRDRMRNRSPLRRSRSRSPPGGPRGAWRPRSRTPERRDDRGPNASNWRRRSPSPADRSSGRTSGNNSRRSSPHIHPSRLGLSAALNREARARSPVPRSPAPRSPPQSLAFREREREREPVKEREPAKSTPREHSPARPAAPRSPPRGPATLRAPTGPSNTRNFTAPAASPSSTPKQENAQPSAPPSGPPSGPRGYAAPSRGSFAGRGGRGSFGSDRPSIGSDRQSQSDKASWGAAPARPAVETTPKPTPQVTRAPSSASSSVTPASPAVPTGPSGGIPTGPRAGTATPSRPTLQHSSSVYGARSQVPSTPTGPRPHPAMAHLPQIIPGGRIDPTASGMTPDVAAKLKKKEAEEEILREDLRIKQEKLRKNLKEYERLQRESASHGLRSELSERHVRMLAGEGVGGAAF